MAESMKPLLKCAYHEYDMRAAIRKFLVIRYLGGPTRGADSKEKAAYGELSGAWTEGSGLLWRHRTRKRLATACAGS